MVPTLAFNDATSSIWTNVVATGDKVAAMLPKLNSFSSLSGDKNFELKMSSVVINGLAMLSYSHNGVCFERDDCNGFDLVIPIDGENYTEVDGKKYVFNAGKNAFLSSFEKRRSTIMKSGVNIRLDPQRIIDTCAAMMGIDSKHRIDFNTRTPSLQRDGIPFLMLFNSVFSQIDSVAGDTNILQKIAADDAIYRLALGLIHADTFLVDDTHKQKEMHVRIELEKVCEWARAHLTQPISLTEMERMSGLSARVLQYSFKKSLGLSPKEWLRKQRLHAARSVLLNPNDNITLTSLAYDFCFSSPSEFSQYYKQEFGELPSKTIKRLRY